MDESYTYLPSPPKRKEMCSSTLDVLSEIRSKKVFFFICTKAKKKKGIGTHVA